MEALQSTFSSDLLPLLTQLSTDLLSKPIEAFVSANNRDSSAGYASNRCQFRTVMKMRTRSAGRSKQTRQLEWEVKERRKLVSVLLQDNLFLRTRHSMLQQVIAWKDEQVARLTSMQDDYTRFNPFLQWGTTLLDFPAVCTPQWYASRCITHCNEKIAMLLASAAPVLAVCPLLLGPASWQQKHLAISFLVNYTSLPVGATELQPLLALVQEVDKLRVSTTHAYLRIPAMLLGAGAHISLLNGTYGTWEALGSAVSRSAENLQACLPETPSIAPEYHWRRVIAGCKLDDQQRLQAFTLWDILSSARKAVTTQRATLLKALVSRQQPVTLGNDTSRRTSQSAQAALWKDSEQLHQEEQLLEELNDVLTKERCLFLLIGEVFLWKVLSPVQVAMLTVGCHPYMPDFATSALAALLQALIHAAALECTPDVMNQLLHKEEQQLWGTGHA